MTIIILTHIIIILALYGLWVDDGMCEFVVGTGHQVDAADSPLSVDSLWCEDKMISVWNQRIQQARIAFHQHRFYAISFLFHTMSLGPCQSTVRIDTVLVLYRLTKSGIDFCLPFSSRLDLLLHAMSCLIVVSAVGCLHVVTLLH